MTDITLPELPEKIHDAIDFLMSDCELQTRQLLKDFIKEYALSAMRENVPKFPERDISKPAEEQGIFHKFQVARVDGTDGPGGKHEGCRYFVLDLDHDAHAADAMRAYAQSCAMTHPVLSAAIKDMLNAVPDSEGGK